MHKGKQINCDEMLRNGAGVFAASWTSPMNNLKSLQTITALFPSLGIGVMMPGSQPSVITLFAVVVEKPPNCNAVVSLFPSSE